MISRREFILGSGALTIASGLGLGISSTRENPYVDYRQDAQEAFNAIIPEADNTPSLLRYSLDRIQKFVKRAPFRELTGTFGAYVNSVPPEKVRSHFRVEDEEFSRTFAFYWPQEVDQKRSVQPVLSLAIQIGKKGGFLAAYDLTAQINTHGRLLLDPQGAIPTTQMSRNQMVEGYENFFLVPATGGEWQASYTEFGQLISREIQGDGLRYSESMWADGFVNLHVAFPRIEDRIQTI